MVWVLACVVVAALAAFVYFSIVALERFRRPAGSESGWAGNVGEFGGDIPDVRIADDMVAWSLFAAPHHDKLFPLLERGKIDAWGRLGNGRPPLTIIPADQWKTHYLVNLPADAPDRINQTFFRPKARPYESTYYDVHLNRSQLERAWPGLWQQASIDRIPCTELVKIAAERGWDFVSRHSLHLIDLQDAIRQGGVDGVLNVWGKENKFRPPADQLMRQAPLVVIPAWHWANYRVHIIAAQYGGDNSDTYSFLEKDEGEKKVGDRGYSDLHVDRTQASSWLQRDAAQFKGRNKPR
jgi:hypothetical protein